MHSTGLEGAALRLGSVTVRPRERAIDGPAGSVSLEPLVVRLLLLLCERAGHLVSRQEIFERCWGSASVGDDSLNRAVAALRRGLAKAAGETIRVETVSGTGYVLRLASEGGIATAAAGGDDVEAVLREAYDSWRLGLPRADHVRLEELRRAIRTMPDEARLWGSHALLCRHAAEYGRDEERAAFTSECEAAARRALGLDPGQPEARIALATLLTNLGRWGDTRRALEAVLDDHPGHLIAMQDLATLAMSTGRVRAGKALRDVVQARDPLAAVTSYKSVYMHWSVGDIEGMDRIANRAMLQWPTHPALWMGRLWTFVYSDRPAAALAMTEPGAVRPEVPAPTLAFLRKLLATLSAGDPLSRLRGDILAFARSGPAAAIAAMFALGLDKDVDGQFELADAYYFHQGRSPVPSHHTPAELSLNEHHRRFTQILFTPVYAAAREDQRFDRLCERIGLAAYWTEEGIVPDWRSERVAPPGGRSSEG